MKFNVHVFDTLGRNQVKIEIVIQTRIMTAVGLLKIC